MYMYPDNLKEGNIMAMVFKRYWNRRCGGNHWSDCYFSCQFLYANGISRCYAFLTIRMADTSIFDFLSYAFAFFIFSQQLYKWHFTGEIKTPLNTENRKKKWRL